MDQIYKGCDYFFITFLTCEHVLAGKQSKGKGRWVKFPSSSLHFGFSFLSYLPPLTNDPVQRLNTGKKWWKMKHVQKYDFIIPCQVVLINNKIPIPVTVRGGGEGGNGDWTQESGRNRPFQSCLLPLCQNESSCQTTDMEMCSTCMFIFMQIKFIFIWKVFQKNLSWNRGTTQGNLEMAYWAEQ